MANSAGYRFMACLLVLYLASTAFFLLFIQHTSERHLTARHSARSPLLLRRAAQTRSSSPSLEPSESSRVRRAPPPPQTQRLLMAAAGRKAAGGRHLTAAARSETGKGSGKTATGGPRPLILFWTPLRGQFANWARFFSVPRLGECRARCSFTSHEDQLKAASLVLFSAADVHRMPPPLLVSRQGRVHRQLWALFSLDPPPAETRLQPQQLDQLFNWTVSYRRDSDVPLVYGRVVPLASHAHRAPAVRLPPGRRALFRPQLCRTRSRREEYVRELSRHMDVDVLGPCGNVTCGAAPQCLASHAGNHTFYLALEAADCADFVSTRLHQALRHGLVPVVRGGSDYTRLAPPGSFIDAAVFSGPAALARHLRTMSDGELRRYHRWRGTHQVLPADWACDVCTRLHQLAARGEKVPAHRGDWLVSWWEQGRCREDAKAPPAA